MFYLANGGRFSIAYTRLKCGGIVSKYQGCSRDLTTQDLDRDGDSRSQDWDRDFEIWVSRRLETETRVSRTTSLANTVLHIYCVRRTACKWKMMIISNKNLMNLWQKLSGRATLYNYITFSTHRQGQLVLATCVQVTHGR